MKVNWCKLFIHKWQYNKEGTERTCKRINCQKHEFWDADNIGSGFATDGSWEDIKKKSIVYNVKD